MEEIRHAVRTKDDFFNCIISKNCWSFIAGTGTGSMVTLAFGRKIPRARPLKNRALSQEQKMFDGEFVVFIKEAPWSVLDQSKTTICTSDDSNEANGPMLCGLRMLIDSPVDAVLSNHERLSILFENGCSLLIEELSKFEPGERYSLFHLGCIVPESTGGTSN